MDIDLMITNVVIQYELHSLCSLHFLLVSHVFDVMNNLKNSQLTFLEIMFT